MSEELEQAIRERSSPEPELVELVRREIGEDRNGALEFIAFVRGEFACDVVALGPQAGDG